MWRRGESEGIPMAPSSDRGTDAASEPSANTNSPTTTVNTFDATRAVCAVGVTLPGRGPNETLYVPGGRDCHIQIREVREAMNWLIDRDYITTQIDRGLAIPFIAPFHPSQVEYARQPVFFPSLERRYDFDPTRAREAIAVALSVVPGMTRGEGIVARDTRPVGHRVQEQVLDERGGTDRLEVRIVRSPQTVREASEADGMRLHEACGDIVQGIPTDPEDEGIHEGSGRDRGFPRAPRSAGGPRSRAPRG
jgi:hypothetical protein